MNSSIDAYHMQHSKVQIMNLIHCKQLEKSSLSVLIRVSTWKLTFHHHFDMQNRWNFKLGRFWTHTLDLCWFRLFLFILFALFLFLFQFFVVTKCENDNLLRIVAQCDAHGVLICNNSPYPSNGDDQYDQNVLEIN